MTTSASTVRAKIRQIEQQLSAIESRGGTANGIPESTIRFLEDKKTELSFQLFMQLRHGGSRDPSRNEPGPAEMKAAG
ncbi:MAG TPA: hypothetical protein VGD08_21475 [Stellaceae bacterium]